MARNLLAAYGSLGAVADAGVDDLRRRPGIGRVRAARITEALHGTFVAPADREPEPERAVREGRPPRRWLLTGADATVELPSFDRRAIALRALRSTPPGTRLVDGLTGEVVATHG